MAGVTGAQKIANVEIFLDNASLGRATIAGPPRTDISSRTRVQSWRISVNLDNTARVRERCARSVKTSSVTADSSRFSACSSGPGTELLEPASRYRP
jgi:hypothetical protein